MDKALKYIAGLLVMLMCCIGVFQFHYHDCDGCTLTALNSAEAHECCSNEASDIPAHSHYCDGQCGLSIIVDDDSSCQESLLPIVGVLTSTTLLPAETQCLAIVIPESHLAFSKQNTDISPIDSRGSPI